jgi:proteasome-associated ATPase
MVAKLTSPPFHAATFVKAVATPMGTHALVLHGGSQRVVQLLDGVSLSELKSGDEVFLATTLNIIVARSPRGSRYVGETAFFERKLDNGALAVRWHDEELIVEATPELAALTLNAGDLIRFDRIAWMAFEKVERARTHKCILEDAPDISSSQIGGLETEVETLISALTIGLTAPEIAARYGLSSRQSILMVGPPGCGKTLMARAAAREVTRVSGAKCRIAVVKPSEWEGPYVGETQMAIRNFFKSLQEAATEGFVVAFLDEIEAVGRIRGSASGQHSDKFLAAFLAELDGFADRKNIAIIAATNRKDLIDGALLQRISDIEIPVGRPSAQAARAIFKIHLPETLPYHPNGSEALATCEAIIQNALSRLYSPNADNGICVIRFRDGKERTILARELISGRIIEQICRHARRAAGLREARREGEPGLRIADIDEAVTEAMDKMRTTLSIDNAHFHLHDLPQDISVVSVVPIINKVKQSGRYLN